MINFAEVERQANGKWTANVHGISINYHREFPWYESMELSDTAEEAEGQVDAYVLEMRDGGEQIAPTFNTYVLGGEGVPDEADC